jgi:hypothetical protein
VDGSNGHMGRRFGGVGEVCTPLPVHGTSFDGRRQCMKAICRKLILIYHYTWSNPPRIEPFD